MVNDAKGGQVYRDHLPLLGKIMTCTLMKCSHDEVLSINLNQTILLSCQPYGHQTWVKAFMIVPEFRILRLKVSLKILNWVAYDN